MGGIWREDGPTRRGPRLLLDAQRQVDVFRCIQGELRHTFDPLSTIDRAPARCQEIIDYIDAEIERLTAAAEVAGFTVERRGCRAISPEAIEALARKGEER